MRTSLAVGAVLLSSLAGAQWSTDLVVRFDGGKVAPTPVLSYSWWKLRQVPIVGDVTLGNYANLRNERPVGGQLVYKQFALGPDLEGRIGLAWQVVPTVEATPRLYLGFSLVVR